MAFEVKEEVVGVGLFYKDVGALDVKESADIALQTFQPVPSAVSPDSVFVDIEGIHSIITRNFTYYTPEFLRNWVPYWTSPYERPVIMLHKDQDGIQVGRVKSVEYVEKTRSTKDNGPNGTVKSLDRPSNQHGTYSVKVKE